MNPCRNVIGFLSTKSHKIAGHKDFVKTVKCYHLMQMKSWNCNLTLYSFGWRMLQSQDETLRSKNIDFNVWISFKYNKLIELCLVWTFSILLKLTRAYRFSLTLVTPNPWILLFCMLIFHLCSIVSVYLNGSKKHKATYTWFLKKSILP